MDFKRSPLTIPHTVNNTVNNHFFCHHLKLIWDVTSLWPPASEHQTSDTNKSIYSRLAVASLVSHLLQDCVIYLPWCLSITSGKLPILGMHITSSMQQGGFSILGMHITSAGSTRSFPLQYNRHIGQIVLPQVPFLKTAGYFTGKHQ